MGLQLGPLKNVEPLKTNEAGQRANAEPGFMSHVTPASHQPQAEGQIALKTREQPRHSVYRWPIERFCDAARHQLLRDLTKCT